MRFSYTTQGVCTQQIDFDYNDGIVSNIEFYGGCNGNLKAISKLVDGWSADKINEKLAGNTCGYKSTSCADQLAKAVMLAKKKAEKE